MTLERTLGHVPTPWGRVQAKKVETPTGPVLYPEYEDCCRLAKAKGISLREIYTEVGRRRIEEFVAAGGQGENK